MNANAWAAATQAGAKLGVSPSLLYGQFAGETGNFTNSGAQNNNFSGFTTGKTSFSSPSTFADYFVNQIQTNYPNAVGTGSNVGDYVAGLTNGRIGTYYAGANSAGQLETAALYTKMIVGNMPAANVLNQMVANFTGSNVKNANGTTTVSNPGGTVANPTGSGNITQGLKVNWGSAAVMIFGALLVLGAVALSQKGTIVQMVKGK